MHSLVARFGIRIWSGKVWFLPIRAQKERKKERKKDYNNKRAPVCVN